MMLKALGQTYDFVGRVEAINRVQIQARVKGFLEAVRFKEDDVVKEGDPLYRIEQSARPQQKVPGARLSPSMALRKWREERGVMAVAARNVEGRMVGYGDESDPPV
jgi:multidrug efflux pump subunit AcrA (membrane-fusion protein)